MQKTASHYQRQMADIVINPKVGHIRWDEMGRADELMAAGYEAALKRIPDIRALIDTVDKAQSSLRAIFEFLIDSTFIKFTGYWKH